MEDSIRFEKCIDFYYGIYKKNILGKKNSIKLGIYPSYIEGIGFDVYENELNNDTSTFEIPLSRFIKAYVGLIGKEQMLCIDYLSDTIVSNNRALLALPGIQNVNKWIELIDKTKNIYDFEKKREQQVQIEKKNEQNRLTIEKEQKAEKFYHDCYSFHIKQDTPVYEFFSEKNKIAAIYIDGDKSLNFIKIDGYAQEEKAGVITYNNIHYFDKAGNISYVTDIKGDYSSYGGSMTGGNFSKLATVGGGLLFGIMGMAMGAALTYKPAYQEETKTTFTIDSDIKKIDDRSVMLNFYSEMKKQYIDIELPQDIYNFLQTYIPEKKYSIVEEFEKKTFVSQSVDTSENAVCMKSLTEQEDSIIDEKESLSVEEFKIKVEKLKIMKEAGLLSDEKFEEEQAKLLLLL